MASKSGTSSFKHFLRDCSGQLPLVIFLSAVGWLIHHASWYKPFKLLLLRPAVMLSQPSPDAVHSTGSVVPLVLSEQFFDTTYQRRLPLDRGVTAKVLLEIAEQRPRLIALAIDATPSSGSERDKRDAEALHEAVRHVLALGIDVVLTTYPRSPTSTRQASWLAGVEALCGLAGKPAGARPGRLAVAASWMMLEATGLDAVVTSVERPNEHNRHLFPQVIAELASTTSPTGPRGVCGTGQHLANPDKLRRPPAGGSSIDSAPLVAVPLHRRSQPSFPVLLENDLLGKIVLIGAATFEGLDTVETARGPLPGVVVQAAMVETLLHPSLLPRTITNVLSFLGDIAIGLLLVVGLESIQWFARRLRQRGFADIVRLGFVLVMLAALLLSLFLLLLWISSSFLLIGYWLDPLPIGFGLLLHFYGDLVRDHQGCLASAGPEPPGIRGWWAETSAAWQVLARWPRGQPDAASITLGLWRLSMVACVGWALVGIATGH